LYPDEKIKYTKEVTKEYECIQPVTEEAKPLRHLKDSELRKREKHLIPHGIMYLRISAE